MPEIEESAPEPPPSVRRALAHRDFALLWSGQALSNIGNMMLPVTLGLLVLSRGGGVTELGLVLAAQTVALGLGAVVATAVGDRWRRTRTMAVADVMRIVAVVGLAAAPHDLALAWIVGLVVVIGIGEGLFQPAFGAVVPKVVPTHLLQPANGLTSLSIDVATIAGPAIAGVCAAVWGVRATLWIDAATFVVSLATLISIREAAVAAGQRAVTGLRGAVTTMAVDLREGVAAVVKRRWLVSTIGSVTAVTMVAAAPSLVLLPVVAQDRLGGGDAYGAVLAAAGVGSLLGSVIASRVRTSRPGLVAFGFSTLNAVSMAGLALLPLPGVMVSWALAGLGVTAFNVLWITALQRDVPQEVLGRVLALDWLGSTCFMPLGFLLAGTIVHTIGNVPLLLGAALFTLVVTPLPLLVRGAARFATPPDDDQPLAAPAASAATH
jgi:MFS family permease